MVTGWLDVQSASLERSKPLECREITGAHTLGVHTGGIVGIFLTLGEAKGLMGLKERRIISSGRISFAAPVKHWCGYCSTWVGDTGERNAYHHGVLFHVCTSKSTDGG